MISKVKWNNHSILGSLELDFAKADGSIYNTIIFAGENGTGKTTILETLSTFLNLGSIEPFAHIEYAIDNSLFKLTPPSNKEHVKHGFHIRTDSSGNTTEIRSVNEKSIEIDTFDIRHYGCVYSKARSGFKTQPVKSTTTQQIDDMKHDDDKNDDFTKIKQLLVDISAQDNSAFAYEGRTKGSATWSKFEPQSKTYRFKKAFNDFFDTLKYDRVDETYRDEKRIVFKKHNNEIDIDSLSTGEKQIVFRGAVLLKNSGNINGGTVLIDEPELSMHPKWQGKILQYYRDLFTVTKNQTVQMIIATHSDHVLRAGLSDCDNVLIIILNDNTGSIESKRILTPSALPTITAAETNYLAFGILSIDYHIELYSYLQSKTTKDFVKDCDNYILTQPQYDSSKHAKPDTYTNSKGNTTTYQTLPTYIRNAIDHPDSGRVYTPSELKVSIELLVELCR